MALNNFVPYISEVEKSYSLHPKAMRFLLYNFSFLKSIVLISLLCLAAQIHFDSFKLFGLIGPCKYLVCVGGLGCGESIYMVHGPLT
jgi:hypothetical protein